LLTELEKETQVTCEGMIIIEMFAMKEAENVAARF
jgi:hypothetical protein